MTIERIVEMLEIEHECMLKESHLDCDGKCGSCKLVQDDGELHEMYTNAIAMLKAQEPRVMTLAELWHMEHKPVYLERKNSRLYMAEPSIVLKAERMYIPSLVESYILMRENKIHDKYLACDYNKSWRCWTSRPTDEQRRATPWN